MFQMEAESDIFNIRVSMPDLTSHKHQLECHTDKIVIYSEKNTAIELRVKLGKSHQSIYTFQIRKGANTLCLCKYKLMVKPGMKLTMWIETINYMARYHSTQFNADPSSFSETAKLVKHTMAPAKNCTFYYMQFSPVEEWETRLKQRIMPDEEPTDFYIKMSKCKLQIENVITKLNMSAHQTFLLNLAPNSLYCEEMYDTVGHFTMITSDFSEIEMTTTDHEKVKTYMSKSTYEHLFEQKNSPQVIKTTRERRIIEPFSEDEDDDDHVIQYDRRLFVIPRPTSAERRQFEAEQEKEREENYLLNIKIDIEKAVGTTHTVPYATEKIMFYAEEPTVILMKVSYGETHKEKELYIRIEEGMNVLCLCTLRQEKKYNANRLKVTIHTITEKDSKTEQYTWIKDRTLTEETRIIRHVNRLPRTKNIAYYSIVFKEEDTENTSGPIVRPPNFNKREQDRKKFNKAIHRSRIVKLTEAQSFLLSLKLDSHICTGMFQKNGHQNTLNESNSICRMTPSIQRELKNTLPEYQYREIFPYRENGIFENYLDRFLDSDEDKDDDNYYDAEDTWSSNSTDTLAKEIRNREEQEMYEEELEARNNWREIEEDYYDNDWDYV